MAPQWLVVVGTDATKTVSDAGSSAAAHKGSRQAQAACDREMRRSSPRPRPRGPSTSAPFDPSEHWPPRSAFSTWRPSFGSAGKRSTGSFSDPLHSHSASPALSGFVDYALSPDGRLRRKTVPRTVFCPACLDRYGALAQNLTQSVSLHSPDKIEPSKPGIKYLTSWMTPDRTRYPRTGLPMFRRGIPAVRDRSKQIKTDGWCRVGGHAKSAQNTGLRRSAKAAFPSAKSVLSKAAAMAARAAAWSGVPGAVRAFTVSLAARIDTADRLASPAA